MIDLLRVSVDHAVVRANPIPGAPLHPSYPGLTTMSRDALVDDYNVVIEVLNREWRASTQERKRELGAVGTRARIASIYSLAVYDEYVRRVVYWKDELAKRDVSAHNDEVDLRISIIEALVATGLSRHVAAEMTNTEAKMLAEGRRLKIL